MRIGFDAKRFFYNKTGLGNYSRSIIQALITHFPQNEYFLYFGNNDSPFWQAVNQPNVQKPIHSGNKIWFRNFGIVKSLKTENLQVYHGLSNELPIGIANFKGNKICTIHDVIFKIYPNYYKKMDTLIYNYKTKLACKNANHVIATSQQTKTDLQKLYNVTNAKVIYQPIQSHFYETINSANPANFDYFVYISTFNARKNHATLITAFYEIRHQTNYHLVLIGSDGETLNQLKRMVESYNLQHRVHFKHNLPNAQLTLWLKHAKLFVYPSFYEGFGIPLAEAAACNVPILASNIPVFNELGQQNIVYFHPNNHLQLADEMLKFNQIDYWLSQREKVKNILTIVNEKRIATEIMQLYTS